MRHGSRPAPTAWLLALALLLAAGAPADTLARRVVTGTDDAEEEGPDGSFNGPGAMYLNSTDLEMVTDAEAPSSGTQRIGIRFTGVTIPAGSVVTGAYLTVRVVAPDPPNDNDGFTTLTIRGQAADDATTFTSTAYDISNRPTTTAATSWVPGIWTADTDVTSPGLTAIVQEIVARAGWSAGNSLVLIMTGTGSRSASAYDADPARAPQLTMTYRPRRVFRVEQGSPGQDERPLGPSSEPALTASTRPPSAHGH